MPEPEADGCGLLLPPGLQPVLVHLSKNDKGKFSFNPISVNLMTEVFKVVFALIVLLVLVSTHHDKSQAAGQHSRHSTAVSYQRCRATAGAPAHIAASAMLIRVQAVLRLL